MKLKCIIFLLFFLLIFSSYEIFSYSLNYTNLSTIEVCQANDTSFTLTNNNEYISDYYQNYTINLIIDITVLIIINLFLIFIVILFLIPKLKLKKLKNNVRLNLLNNSYFLYYQPIYNPRNNTIVAFEGLLRLKDKNNNIIPPCEFMPELEKNNMLFDISLWVLNKAVEDYKRLKTYTCIDDNDFYISINVSLSEIENKKFLQKAIKILSDSNLGPNKICLEIIERVRSHDLDKINTHITALRNAGFKIAIDDFGVEYSNLDILKKVDFDILKVDKCFVDDICTDNVQREILMFINNLAYISNKTLIIEGIENIYQHNLINNINNTSLYTQGYFYSRPMNIAEIEAL